MTKAPHIFRIPGSLPQGFHPHRRGQRWTPEDDDRLRNMVASGYSIVEMCQLLGRDTGGIIGRFVNLGIAKLNDEGYYVQITDNQPTTTKENSMNPTTTATIETKTFILGRDASTMTDVEIFNLIAKTEAELAKFKGISTKSAKLAAHIARVECDLRRLAEYLDNRA